MFGVRSPEDIKNEILDRYGKQQNQRSTSQETANATSSTQPSDGESRQPSDEEEVSGNRRLSKEGEVVDAELEEASQRIEDNSEPISTEEPIAKKLAQEADAFVKAMGGKGVHIVNDVEELPGSEGMAYRAIKSGEKVMGWYNLANNQVYIYTPNANDEQEVFETLLHEFVAHKGLRDLMGHRNFDNMCKNVWSMMDSNRRLQFALYVKESLAIGSTGMLERINAMSEQEKKDYLDELSDRDCLAAADEFIAHFAEYGVSEEERNIWQKIVDTIRQWLRDVGFIVGISEREIAQLLAESHNRLTRNMTIGEMAEAVMRSKLMHERMNSGVNMGFQMEEAEDVATLNKAGEQLNDKGVLFNIRSNPQVVAARDRQLKRSVRNGVLSQDEAQDIRDFAESITEIATAVANAKEDGVAQFPSFSMWNGLEVRMNAEGKPVVSVIKSNSEYPMNIDFAKDCVKRTALNNVMDVLADRAPWIFNRLTMDNLVVLNDIIKDHGLQVPCVGCFVESKRYRSADYARTVVDVWNKAVEAIQNGTEKDFLKNNQKISEKRIIEYLQKNPQEAIVLSEADIVSPTRYGKLMIEHPEIPILLQQTQGQNNVQLVVPEAIYFGEVLDKQDWSIDEAYSVGGVRMQSFSDFKPKLFFDYCQVLADLSAKRLPAHSYTKVNSFAELFGKTGMKINLSLYFEGRGVDENGEYTYSAESIDPDFAYELQDKEGYTENVGTMAIGLSDEHIWKMLKDPKIRSISPYHKSGINPTVAARLNAEQFTDYTNEQNTCTPATAREEGESWQDYYHRITARVNGKVPNVGKKVDNVGFNMYDSLLDTDNPAQTAKDYVAYCQANGMVPKYASFVYNEDGSFNEEYYKLLFDFSVTDRNGNYAPQKAVTWREGSMPENTAELLKTYLSEEEKATQAVRAEIEPIVDEVMDALGEGTRFRIRNSGYAERDNGTAISKRALKAEENGTFTAGTFRKNYGVSKKAFDILLELGLIKNTEWHHTGANFKQSDFYSWTDSERADGNMDYSNGIAQENSLADIYIQNKKIIEKLLKEYDVRNWEFREKRRMHHIPKFEDYKYNIFSDKWQSYLTDDEEKTRRIQHATISEGEWNIGTSNERRLMHNDVDDKYKQIARSRFEEESDAIQSDYNAKYGSIIKENEELDAYNNKVKEDNLSSNGKEAILMQIGNIFGKEAYNRIYAYSLAEQSRMAKEQRIAEAEEMRSLFKQEEDNMQKALDKWVTEQKKKGNIKYVERIPKNKQPENFIVTREEMYGKYGWFEASWHYNLPIYVSGMEFSSKRLLDSYQKRVNALSTARIDHEREYNQFVNGTRFRIKEVNDRFNEELQQQIDGTLPKGHIYQLGMPGDILISAGIEDLPIELSAERLYAKSTQENHPFSLESVSNLPMAIQSPIAIFDSRTNRKSKVLLTELQYNGNNFVVALRLRNEGEGIDLEVNSIQSLYPKDRVGGVIEWVNTGLLRYANQKKLVDFLTQSTNLIAGKETDLNNATKIINDFENPKLSEENGIRFRTTYHGSASDFAKFDHSFMGTGEGLQSFGWGTYVTEVEDVAKRYANVALKGEQKFKYIGDKDVKKSIVKDAEGLIDNAGGFDEALQMYEGHRLPPHYPLAIAFDFIRSTSESDWEGQRHMYEVEIPDANEAYYIDYKERMSNQGEIFTMVDNALASDGWKRKEVDDKVVFSDGLNRIVLNPKQTGGDFYNELAFGLGSPQAASEYLNDVVGITGIQYDVNYHNGGNEDGTKNYVIFNADDAQVVSNTRFSIRGNAWSDVPAYNPGETIGEYIQRVNAWKLYLLHA